MLKLMKSNMLKASSGCGSEVRKDTAVAVSGVNLLALFWWRVSLRLSSLVWVSGMMKNAI